MATPVLPYPDMDFTPLDILTAAEMDQMVANDQYLRDFCAGLADGTNLSDGVIQARKLDLSSFTNNPKFIQAGTKPVRAYHSNSSGGSETITFSTPFDNTPAVIATPIAFSVFGIVSNVSDISATGFTLIARHTNDSGDPVSVNTRWIAIDVSKLAIKSS